MKRIIISLMICLLLLAQCSILLAAPANWTGTWETDWNKMKLVQTGDIVKGTYEYNEGYLEGKVVGNKLIGKWVQSNSQGEMVFEMNANSTAFQGKWRYYDGDDDDWGDWNGKRIAQ